MSSELEPSRLGRKVTLSTVGEKVEAFIPPPLPPAPPVRMDRLNSLLERANLALGRLDGMTSILPDTDLFLYMYVRKEALLSSQIEGTQSSLSELLLFERADLPGVTLDDVRDVANYVAAMDHGLARIRDDFPISLRLIRELHEILLSKGRGSKRQPGEFRRSQNWIGGSRPGNAVFVPPPPGQVLDLMSDLEKFIHADTPEIPALIKAGLVHVQFETIHPFLDGNGRLGRLLIIFFLIQRGRLQTPLLYLSSYFEAHRQTYYDTLQGVRESGNFEAWLNFFLRGVEVQAGDAITRSERLMDLREHYRQAVRTDTRGAPNALVDLVFQRPFLNARIVEDHLNITRPSALRALRQLQELNVLDPAPDGPRGQLRWRATEVLEILTDEPGPADP